MKTDYDVIIVGAGPAGASCAKHLVDNGVKTLVIEKRVLPRYKCCAGFLNEKTLEFIKNNYCKIPDYITCENSKIYPVITKDSNKYVKLNTCLLNINRDLFDEWLIKNSKVEIRSNSLYLSHIESKDGLLKIKVRTKDSDYFLHCNYLIGADGSASSVRKIIDPIFLTNKGIVEQHIYTGISTIDDNLYYMFLDKKFTDALAGIYYKEKLIHIFSSYYFENKNSGYFELFINFLKDKFNLSLKKEVRKEFLLGDRRGIRKKMNFGKKNILLVGEAAGFITCGGEGISSALISGKNAANSIINNKNTFNNYKELIQEEVEYILKTWNSFF